MTHYRVLIGDGDPNFTSEEDIEYYLTSNCIEVIAYEKNDISDFSYEHDNLIVITFSKEEDVAMFILKFGGYSREC